MLKRSSMPDDDEPATGDSRRPVRQKHKALLIGISGSSTLGDELKTPHRNVTLFRSLLVDLYGYRDEDITVVVDDGIPGHSQPTRVNILNAIADLVKDTKAGDHFCFYYSGLSTQVPNRSNSEEDGMDACLIPMDGEDNLIMDNELNSALVSHLPVGSHLVAIFDTSPAASLLDPEHYRCNQVFVPWRQPGVRRREEWYPELWNNSELPLESSSKGSSANGLLDIPDIPRSESPFASLGCFGWCRESNNYTEVKNSADVISLAPVSSAVECNNLTPFLAEILRCNPTQSLKEMVTSISHRLYALHAIRGHGDFYSLELGSLRPLDMERSVGSLLSAGITAIVEPLAVEEEDIGALQSACMGGDLDTVRLLLERGVTGDTGGEYERALQAASMNGHTEVVALLLESGVDVDASEGDFVSSSSGEMLGSALQAAALAGHAETVRIFLEHGVSVDAAGAQDAIVLKATLRKGHINVVRLLLDSGATRMQDDRVLLVVTGINKRSALISLPMESCRSWRTFRNQLIEEGVQPWQYIQNDEFVVRVEGPTTNLISQENWMGWMSLLCSASTVRPVPWVTLCIIRRETEPCCNSPSENIDGSKCESCGMAIVNPPAKQEFPAPTSRQIPPTIPALSPPRKPQPPSGITQSGQPSATQNPPAAPLTSTPSPVQSFALVPEPVAAVPSQFATAAAMTTAFELTPENSVMRRRHRRTSGTATSTRTQAPSAEPNGRDRSTPTVNAQRPTRWVRTIALRVLRRSFGVFGRLLEKTAKWLVRTIGHCFFNLYRFIIAPPFLIHKDLGWDKDRLENRLAIFQWTMAGNLSLAGLCAALLALTSLQNNRVAQSFVILSGIFSVFGLIYTAFLALHMGDSKKKFCAWFLKQEHMVHTSGSMWNLTVMMSLPLTWMSWAILNLCLGGLSYPIVQLQTDKIADSNTAPFTKVQVAAFSAALVASVLCAFMIHLEIRKYGLSLKSRCNATCESLNGDRDTVESSSISRV